MSLMSLLSLSAFADSSDPDPEKTIFSYLAIRDYQTACREAQKAIEYSSHDPRLWRAYIQALSKQGDEKLMMQAWKRYLTLVPEDAMNRHLLECLAWGVIEKGTHASSPLIRVYASLGAYLGEDAIGIEIIHRNLSDPNTFIRSVALQLTENLPDAILKDDVLRLFRQEKDWSVRIDAIQAVGKLKIKEAKEELIQIIASSQTLPEEKAAAAEALVYIFDKPSREELIKLSINSKAALRELACDAVAYAGDKTDADIIIPLLGDPSADVRAAALQALGILRVSLDGRVQHLLKNPHPKVAIIAAWVSTIQQNDPQENVFQPWLKHPNQEIRLFAGAALVATGHYGSKWLVQAFREAVDPYLKINLAIGMVNQRQNCDEACEEIYQTFINNKERWMWEEKGIFKFIAPSKVKHSELIPNRPEAVNQMTRLEILNLLSIMNHPKAQAAVLHFLQEKSWGISGLASALLLTEGDESALQHVEKVMHHPDHKMRIQSALVLAIWGRGESAITVLQEAYLQADYELKHQILEALGKIGSNYSIPFLTERLNDPHQTTRIIAACALIQCLYH